MRLAHVFIDRPIFATVLSVFVRLIGLGALAIRVTHGAPFDFLRSGTTDPV
jgi:hypothetical protein